MHKLIHNVMMHDAGGDVFWKSSKVFQMPNT
jgi:hypothetical protein